jgi:DNA adenine methylase
VAATPRRKPLKIKAVGRSVAASPLRYPGGKAALAGFFADLIKQIGIRSATYVEPYAGGAGAGVILLQRGIVRKLVINDIDPAVYCFWTSVTKHPDELASMIVHAQLNVDEWRRQQAIYRAADESDPLTLGFAFFYLNRTNRSGILNAGPIGGMNQNGNYEIDARYNRDQLAQRIIDIGTLSDQIRVLKFEMAKRRPSAQRRRQCLRAESSSSTKWGFHVALRLKTSCVAS